MAFVSGLDSVVFDTPDLARVRAFYSGVLGLRVGTHRRDGIAVPDESDTYVNLDTGALLCFESGAAAQTGTIVLRVTDLPGLLGSLRTQGIEPTRERPGFAIIVDPDGREVILQAG